MKRLTLKTLLLLSLSLLFIGCEKECIKKTKPDPRETTVRNIQ